VLQQLILDRPWAKKGATVKAWKDCAREVVRHDAFSENCVISGDTLKTLFLKWMTITGHNTGWESSEAPNDLEKTQMKSLYDNHSMFTKG